MKLIALFIILFLSLPKSHAKELKWEVVPYNTDNITLYSCDIIDSTTMGTGGNVVSLFGNG